MPNFCVPTGHLFLHSIMGEKRLARRIVEILLDTCIRQTPQGHSNNRMYEISNSTVLSYSHPFYGFDTLSDTSIK